MYTSQTDFDLRTIPFSMRGAWFNLSTVVGLHQRSDTVHLVSHRNGINGVLTLTPERGDAAVDTQWIGRPSQFIWRAADGGSVTAVFDGPEVLRLRGDGLGMRVDDAAGELTPFTGRYLFC